MVTIEESGVGSVTHAHTHELVTVPRPISDKINCGEMAPSLFIFRRRISGETLRALSS